MTRYELLDLIVGVLSSAAVVATLLYAAWELRAAREQSALLSAQTLTEQLVTIDSVFIDHPPAARCAEPSSWPTARSKAPR